MKPNDERLLSELSRRGVLTRRELQTAIGVSQPTLSRMLSDQGHARIVRMGQARATRYGLRRELRGLGSEWPLYHILPDGNAARLGVLHALAGGQWVLQQDSPWETLRGQEFRDGVYPDLPWFLQDLRPRGFLGRLQARRCATELGTPSDPQDWSSDDIAHFLLTFGGDLSGAFVLGRRALEIAQSDRLSMENTISEDIREQAYPVLADTIMGGEVAGSSAAGEQPKFTARVRTARGNVQCVIVKFSGRGGRPEDRRWADLLVAESVANTILHDAGIPSASTTVLQADGRWFLESTRFDRTEARGRMGLATLEAFDSAFFGAIETPWPDAADRYQRRGWLSPADADRLTLTWWFGQMIGNTDMHYGNVSLFLDANRPLTLAPTYDMVPMLYRPGIEGQLPDAPVIPSPPPPEALPIWAEAARLAEAFWLALANHNSISPSFSHISTQNAAVISNMQKHFSAPI